MENVNTLNTWLLIITAFGTVGTLIGAWFVLITLKAEHEWRRRKNAMDMVWHWNDCTADHAKAIEAVFPHIRDVDKTTGKVTELTRETAKKIYTCEPADEKNWNTRFQIIELLNHLECIVIAHNNSIVDENIFSEAIQEPIIKWVKILGNFLDVVSECGGHQSWQPLLEKANEWTVKKKKTRKPTA